MEQVAAAATVDVDEIVLEALGFNGFVHELQEAIDAMASADAANEAALETVFNAFAGAIDEIAADEPDELAVLTLGELKEAIDKMVTAATAGEDVVGDLGIADFGRKLLETINKIATAVAAGEVVFLEVDFVDFTLELSEAIDDFTHKLKDAIDEMATMEAANEAVLEALGGHLEEAMDDEMVADGEASLDASGYYNDIVRPIDQVRQGMHAMYEEAVLGGSEYHEIVAINHAREEDLLEELEYHEMVFAVDNALDDMRREAVGCSGNHAPTGFLGRYGFGTPQDLFSQLIHDAVEEMHLVSGLAVAMEEM